MAIAFRKIDNRYICEQSSLVTMPLNPATLSPFPTTLTTGATVDLCEVLIPTCGECSNFTVNAVVNWSVTQIAEPVATGVPIFAQVTFELMRDGEVLYNIIDQIQAPPALAGFPTTPVTAFGLTNLSFLDINCKCNGDCKCKSSLITRHTVFTLTAANIIVSPDATITTVAVGARTLQVQRAKN